MKALEVWYCHANADKMAGLFEILIKRLPQRIGQEITTYKQTKDRHLILLGKLLLQKILSSKGLQGALENIKKDRFGRPYLNKGIDFNISHSGNYSVCAVSLIGRVGIDIERIRTVNISHFQRHMTKSQWQDIVSSDNSLSKFFHYWTLKESVLKADGRGITVPLSSITTKKGIATLEDRQWHVYPIFIDPEYLCHAASENHIEDFPTLYLPRRVEIESFIS